ncbi:hypothetical protein QTN47_27335 [Danxiaibacter flavus]|uniref:Head decoration protein n=1 Tax=Danxiaibacter flavus TaxID=3049108 RepID=A0ABV3ZN32_9BACT|nr:hypothetical protein QNM32_27335 [Chitinophagaceae bacterium DXS]
MGVGFKRKYGTSDIPVFQGYGKDIQLAQGGFLLDTTGLVIGTVLKAGTPMTFDESTRKAKPMATAVVYENAGGTATQYKVKKGSILKVGDNLAKSKGGAAYAITAIDTSNADYDLLTVGTTIGAATAGDVLFASTATGATSAALPVIKGVLYADAVVDSGESVSVAIRATLYARRVPYSVDIAAALPGIIYSQSM